MKMGKVYAIIICILFTPFALSASNVTETSSSENSVPTASAPSPSKHFVWGAEIGTSIDVTGYDSSTFNIDALFGYKNNLIQFLGVGIGLHRAMGNGDNYVPVYATFRTSFTRNPKPFFMSLKFGYSFNTIGDANTFGDINASIGAGINLASSRKFRSYLILAYEFRHFNEKHRDAVAIEDPNISMASLSLGFNF